MSNPGSPQGKTTKPLAAALQALCKCTRSKNDPHYVLTGQGLRAINAIRSARDVRHLIGLSLTAMSDTIAAAVGHHYTGGAVANMESPIKRYRDRVWHTRARRFKMPSDVIEVYRQALIAAVHEASHGAIDLRITITKWGTWHATPIGHCSICGDPFTIKRAGVARCPWCIGHNQTKRKAGNP